MADQLVVVALRVVVLAYVTLVLLHSSLERVYALRSRRQRRTRPVGAPVPASWPAVDVVIPCFNEDPSLLEACCRSVAGQDYPGTVRVWLVDDGSRNRAALLAVYERWADRGWDVTAVDFSDVALEKGRQRVEALQPKGSVEWICADLLDFDPAGVAYDLVLFLFIHLPPGDRRRLLRRAATTLNPGGMLLVVGYDTTHVPTSQQGGGPKNRFSPEDIVEDLRGLRIERAERLQVGDAVDAIVRAVRD
jgi:SAM-dependent methyltransferase